MLQVEHELESLLARQRTLLEVKEKILEQIAADQRAPKADWQSRFSWDAKVQGSLAGVFKLADFRCCTNYVHSKVEGLFVNESTVLLHAAEVFALSVVSLCLAL